MSYLEILKNSIAELVEDFRSNPFDYLYEADLQAALFSIARAKFKSKEMAIWMEGGYHASGLFPDKYAVGTTPVKCEYPSGKRFDIAIIDPKRVEPFESTRARTEGWKNERFWAQPLCAAVEIKYLQLGDRLNHRAAGLKSDLAKLKGYQFADPGFCGIAMLFVQASAQYSEKPCDGMEKIKDISAVSEGFYVAVIGPTEMSWYRAKSA